MNTPFEYIETTAGRIYKNDIPYVVDESFLSQFNRAIVFYSVFLIVIILLLYISNKRINEDIRRTAKHKMNLKNHYSVKKIPSYAHAQKIKLYNYHEEVPVEHIILIDIYGNLIDVDIERNYFVEKIRLGTDGLLYIIDFGVPKSVREITILTDPEKLLKEIGYTIELYDTYDNMVWSHTDSLNEKEQTLPIYINIPIKEIDTRLYKYEQLPKGNSKEIIIFNENALFLKLNEDGDDSFNVY